jgi:hypothetical protein
VQETKRLVQILPERRIITTIAQNSRSSLNALAGKVLGKDLLSHLRALGGLGSVGASVGVGNAKEPLGHHVEVEVDEEVVDVLGREGRGVVLAAQEAVLFGSPPGEADLVLGLVL